MCNRRERARTVRAGDSKVYILDKQLFQKNIHRELHTTAASQFNQVKNIITSILPPKSKSSFEAMAPSDLKPIKLYRPESSAPNPWKVAFILEELGLPYEIVITPEDTIKDEPFISINPNGRLPGVVDPNKNITLWEVGAPRQILLV